ncbi:hypothetical protein [Rhizobium sp. IBUN]|uniref:hypothetical protein n=1 Tax=Rhizobium sp. IBUN TaxID=1042326 RepID=UPI0012EB83BC|nr:hypothetical protein [Rhizobium sp. IBUN]
MTKRDESKLILRVGNTGRQRAAAPLLSRALSSSPSWKIYQAVIPEFIPEIDRKNPTDLKRGDFCKAYGTAPQSLDDLGIRKSHLPASINRTQNVEVPERDRRVSSISNSLQTSVQLGWYLITTNYQERLPKTRVYLASQVELGKIPGVIKSRVVISLYFDHYSATPGSRSYCRPRSDCQLPERRSAPETFPERIVYP